MAWQRAIDWRFAYVDCDGCGRWFVTIPTDAGVVDDVCSCGVRVRAELRGWEWQRLNWDYIFDDDDAERNTAGT